MGGWKWCWWRELHQPLSAGNFNLKLRRSGKSFRKVSTTQNSLPNRPLNQLPSFEKRILQKVQPWPDFPTRSHLAFGPEARCRFPRRRWSFQSTQYKGELRWRLNQIWFILRASLVLSILSILNIFSLYTTLAVMRENLHSCGFPDIYNHTLPSPNPHPLLTHIFSFVS